MNIIFILLGSFILIKLVSFILNLLEPLNWGFRQKTLNHLTKLIYKFYLKGNSKEILKELIFLYQQTYVAILFPAYDIQDLDQKFKDIYNQVFHIENLEDIYEILNETKWKLLSSKMANRIQKLRKKFIEKEIPKIEKEVKSLIEIIEEDSKYLEKENNQTFHENFYNNKYKLEEKENLLLKILPVINLLEYTFFQLNFLHHLTGEEELEGSIDYLNEGLLLALNTNEDYPIIFDSIKEMVEKTLKKLKLLDHYRKNGFSPLKSDLKKNIWFKESIVSNSIKNLFN